MFKKMDKLLLNLTFQRGEKKKRGENENNILILQLYLGCERYL